MRTYTRQCLFLGPHDGKVEKNVEFGPTFLLILLFIIARQKFPHPCFILFLSRYQNLDRMEFWYQNLDPCWMEFRPGWKFGTKDQNLVLDQILVRVNEPNLRVSDL